MLHSAVRSYGDPSESFNAVSGYLGVQLPSVQGHNRFVGYIVRLTPYPVAEFDRRLQWIQSPVNTYVDMDGNVHVVYRLDGKASLSTRIDSVMLSFRVQEDLGWEL